MHVQAPTRTREASEQRSSPHRRSRGLTALALSLRSFGGCGRPQRPSRKRVWPGLQLPASFAKTRCRDDAQRASTGFGGTGRGSLARAALKSQETLARRARGAVMSAAGGEEGLFALSPEGTAHKTARRFPPSSHQQPPPPPPPAGKPSGTRKEINTKWRLTLRLLARMRHSGGKGCADGGSQQLRGGSVLGGRRVWWSSGRVVRQPDQGAASCPPPRAPRLMPAWGSAVWGAVCVWRVPQGVWVLLLTSQSPTVAGIETSVTACACWCCQFPAFVARWR